MCLNKTKILLVETDDISDSFNTKKNFLENIYFLLKDVRFRLWFEDSHPEINRFDWLFSQPIGLSFLSHALKKTLGERIEVIFYSFTLNRFYPNYQSWRQTLQKLKPEIIAFSNNNFISENKCIEKIKIAKNIIPQAKLILGGVNATFRKEFFLKNAPVDYVVIGEAEQIIIWVVQKIIGNKNAITDFRIKSKKTADNQFIVYQDSKNDITDIETDYSGIFHKYYLSIAPFAIIQSQRGCNYSCSFCIGRLYWGNKVRCRGIKNVIMEIKFLIKNGAKLIHFIDADFFASQKHAERVLETIIQEKFDSVLFGIQTRIDNLDEKKIIKLKRANVRYVFSGIENIDKTILSKLGKGRELESRQITSIIRSLYRHKIFSDISFLVDRHYLNRDILKKNVQAMQELYTAGAGWVDIRNYLPFPGLKTAMFNSGLEKKNYFFYGYPVCGLNAEQNQILRKQYLKFMEENVKTVIKQDMLRLNFYKLIYQSHRHNSKKFSQGMKAVLNEKIDK